MSHCCCCHDQAPSTDRRSNKSLFGTLVGLVLLYLVLVFAGGTMIQSGHPVAVETGEIIHLLTFVEPLTEWVDSVGLGVVANGLEMVSDGFPIQRYV